MRTLISLLLIFYSFFAYSQDWKEGHYYDLKGKAHYGQIKYKYNFPPKISYKNPRTGKTTNIKSWKSKGFVIEGDSFAILQDFETLEGDKIAHDFAQVVEVGDIILFKNFSNVLRSKHVDPNGNPLWYKKHVKLSY